MDEREVRRAVRELVDLTDSLPGAAANDVRDDGLARLAALRSEYRHAPNLFDAALIEALKNAASRLQTMPPPSEEVQVAQRAAAVDVLSETFGYDSFRKGQREVIDAILAGRDCLGIMPTGAGKSLTYQIPARVLGGLTLVVSPLIALMKDQVDRTPLRATFLNSSISLEERDERVARILRGEIEIVYVAPEGLQASAGRILDRVKPSLIAIDEAHCISQWGHDFRPAYRNLSGLKKRFRGIPILALTATATTEVTADIVTQLGMVQPAVFRGSFLRPNLKLRFFKKGGERSKIPPVRDAILRIARSLKGQSGIVYCLSRKSVEQTRDYLLANGVRAIGYHAGMEPEARAYAQESFREDRYDVVCATIAFGMGIDKPDVRYVIHRDMPRSIEGYYQEIGRAGRDGLDSQCIMFYSWADVLAYERMTEESSDFDRAKQQVREMYRFAEAPRCRHKAVAGYFGEKIDACGTSCDVCLGEVDVFPKLASAEPVRSKAAKAKTPKKDVSLSTAQAEVLTLLKSLRRHLCESKGIPAYVVFNDSTLIEMAATHPTTPDELLAITGVGPLKLQQWGEPFLKVLQEEARGRK